MNKVNERISFKEEILGRGLMQPFNNTNSGMRKIMFGTHLEHRLPLMSPEVPLIQTGYENEFGKYSSSYIPADSDYRVIGKVSKFSFEPTVHYYLILADDKKKELKVIERVAYKHITETYGFLLNNEYIDCLKPNDRIDKGTIIQKSQSYDNYDNRMDGINLLTAYISCDNSMEDGIILSESAAKKLVSPLLKKVTIIINDNDILLNLYGNDQLYKTFPDIGEEIKDGILCATRREKKEESLFTQSYNRLKDIMMSDDKLTVKGKVIDIDVYCNNPENLNSSYYNGQLKRYYDEGRRFNQDLVNLVKPLMEDGYKLEYNLQKLYSNANKALSGVQYFKDKSFSNIIMEVIVMEESVMNQGDKLSDRYGGKGVVSKIIPDDAMPVTDTGETIEIMFNSSTCVNRLNAGQLFEVSLTHIGSRIINFIQMGVLDVSESIELYIKYVTAVSKSLGQYIETKINAMSDDEAIAFMGSVMMDNGIMLSIQPISESMDIDRLNQIYQTFPWATQCDITVPIEGSNGVIRRVKARRPIVCGRKYIYRLKQYAEEKFSATSLSSTNIRNENSRSKANKAYKALYTKTPIRFGEMESGNLSHVGIEEVVINLMIHSASPHGRRLAEELLTGDPFNIDIKLDMDSKNRNVEILNAYLKTMGLRLVFEKVYKEKIKPYTIKPIIYLDNRRDIIKPYYKVSSEEKFDPNYILYMREKLENNGLIRPYLIKPLRKVFEKGGSINE